MENDICSIELRCTENGLQKKTLDVVVSRSRDGIVFICNLSNEHIQRGCLLWDLGIQVNSKLHSRSHVSYVVKDALQFLRIALSLTKQVRNRNFLRTLYCAICAIHRPCLETSCVVWNNLLVTSSDLIEKVKLRFISIVYDQYIGPRRFYS